MEECLIGYAFGAIQSNKWLPEGRINSVCRRPALIFQHQKKLALLKNNVNADLGFEKEQSDNGIDSLQNTLHLNSLDNQTFVGNLQGFNGDITADAF